MAVLNLEPDVGSCVMNGYPLANLPRRESGAVDPWAGEVFVFPTTIGQQGFWYLDQLDPGNPAYNIAVRFRLEGPLDQKLLTRALNEIIKRHESLRTIIASDDGVPVQLVAPELTIRLPVDDLRSVPESARDPRAEYLTVEEARRRFDLGKGPLFRARLLKLGDEDHVLLVTVHHVIADGWSIGVFTQELGSIYEAFSRKLDSPLPELSLQYGDFAVWQKEWLERTDLSVQLSYWTRRLADLPLLEVPTDKRRPEIQTPNGHIESLVLSRQLTDRLIELSSRHESTFFMVALAALKILLQRSTGEEDVYVGSLVAGRSRVQLEPLIGMFINPIVLRTDLSGDPTFLELLVRVRETVLEGLAHQDYPFERIVSVIHPRRDPSRHPVFQINFIYQRDFVRPLHFSGLTLTAIPSRSPGAIYDLNFFMVERADGWRASCEYNTDLYEAATITRLLDQFQSLLEGVAADPNGPISAIPMRANIDREPAPPENRIFEQSQGPQGNHVVAKDRRNGPSLPSDTTVARLSKLWERMLGTRPSSTAADFFDEGGHSLLAARFLAMIEKEFGKRISLAAFLQAPSIQGLATRLEGKNQGGSGDQVHAIQPNGDRTPLFVVTSQPPLYRLLSRKIGNDQPMFGLAWPELTALPAGFTVHDIARNLVTALRSVQPRGPYYLAGWCMSGLVVYVMAQQLRALREEVALLALFDANTPTYLRGFQGWKGLPVRMYIGLVKLLYTIRNRPKILPEKLLAIARNLARKAAKCLGNQVAMSGSEMHDDRAQEHELDSMKMQNKVVANYEPEPYDGSLVLFRSERHQTGRFRDPMMGWGKLVRGGINVHEIPGGHHDMFYEPEVELLAQVLNRYLIAETDNRKAVYARR